MSMAQTTQEFIAERTKVIQSEIKALRDELAALKSLKAALSGSKSPESGASKTRRVSGHTFQEMIVDVLNDLVDGAADANYIIDLIDKKFKKKIQRSSISPQLSRLKAKGVLDLNDNVWSLTENYRAQKNSGPAGPDDSGDTLSDILGVPPTLERESSGGGT